MSNDLCVKYIITNILLKQQQKHSIFAEVTS